MFFTIYWTFFIVNCLLILGSLLFTHKNVLKGQERDFAVGAVVIIFSSLVGTVFLAVYVMLNTK